ncbi:MAG TPA: hypothetical protein VMU61_11110 [Candidatus Aquilonibacter sp.]|nr:hypothetical protein [Candidatus Aquilonibacter sp.]
MATDNRDILEVLQFELKFLEDGGYGRSPRTPWRAPAVFEDSPTCLNFSNSGRPHPCDECLLMRFVPKEQRGKEIPCRQIPLKASGETIDDLYRSGTQNEMEQALAEWLRTQIQRIQQERQRAAQGVA